MQGGLGWGLGVQWCVDMMHGVLGLGLGVQWCVDMMQGVLVGVYECGGD